MLRSWCLWVEECGAGEVTSIDDCCWWPEAKEKKIGNKQGQKIFGEDDREG